MSRIVITGGAGLLGLNWAIRKASTYDIHLWLHKKNINLDGVSSHFIELSDVDAIAKALDFIKPDVVINAAGFTSVYGCEHNPKHSELSNFIIAKNIAIATSKRSIKLVQVSTDHLFAGTTSLNNEQSPIKCLNTYDKHKSMAENEALAKHPDALVLRTTFFGWGPSYRRSFSDLILDDMAVGRQVRMFDDVFFTPLDTMHLIDITHELLNLNQRGIINICGGERISKYEFSVKLAAKFDYDPDLIQPIQASRLQTNLKRPLDLSLADDKLRGIIGGKSVLVDDAIESLKQHKSLRKQIGRIGQIIPYGRHYIDDADIEAVTNTLKSGFLTQGPAIPKFEDGICEYTGAKYAVAVSSATAGLHLAYMALEAEKGRSVLTSPITFVSTANAAHFCGSKARFADINPCTANIGLNSVVSALDEYDDIHIVAPVLFSGSADGIPEVSKLAKSKGKFVVEDAAHGLGGSYLCGAKIGSCKYSDCTVFSLHPVKSIAAGEGGIITTNDENIYRALLRLRSHGINKNDSPYVNIKDAFTNGENNLWYYEMTTLGFHYRITDIQASLAASQLTKLDLFATRRRELAHRYSSWIDQHEYFSRAQQVSIDHSANHLFTIAIDFETIGKTRNNVMKELLSHNIITQVHYIPVVNQPYYATKGISPYDYPHSQAYYQSTLSIPLYYSLSDDEFNFVLEVLEKVIQ